MTTDALAVGERRWDGPPSRAPDAPCVGCGRMTVPSLTALTVTRPGGFTGEIQAQCLRCRAEQKVATLEARLAGSMEPPVHPDARPIVEAALDYWRETLRQETQ